MVGSSPECSNFFDWRPWINRPRPLWYVAIPDLDDYNCLLRYLKPQRNIRSRISLESADFLIVYYDSQLNEISILSNLSFYVPSGYLRNIIMKLGILNYHEILRNIFFSLIKDKQTCNILIREKSSSQFQKWFIDWIRRAQ